MKFVSAKEKNSFFQNSFFLVFFFLGNQNYSEKPLDTVDGEDKVDVVKQNLETIVQLFDVFVENHLPMQTSLHRTFRAVDNNNSSNNHNNDNKDGRETFRIKPLSTDTMRLDYEPDVPPVCLCWQTDIAEPVWRMLVSGTWGNGDKFYSVTSHGFVYTVATEDSEFSVVRESVFLKTLLAPLSLLMEDRWGFGLEFQGGRELR